MTNRSPFRYMKPGPGFLNHLTWARGPSHPCLAKSMQEHREIKDAILDTNAEKAAILMRDHIMLQGQRLSLLLQVTN